MDVGPLRALTREVTFAAHGVPATVTVPNEATVETRGIWIDTATLEMPVPGEFSRREPQRVIALRRDQVPRAPRGTVILAPEQAGDEAQRWRVDGVDRVEADHLRVIVVADPELEES